VPPTDCDRLAAHPTDPGRLPGVKGVPLYKPGWAWEGVDPSKAIPACEAAVAAQPNVARLIFQLGRAYRSTDRDDARARETFEKAAKLGYPRAMTELAIMLLYGQGGATDLVRPRQLLDAAAELGDPRAVWQLGAMYMNGSAGVERQNLKKARELLEKAAKAGEPQAWEELWSMYGIKGFGVPVDKAKSDAYRKMYDKWQDQWRVK
jgi:TPR repeat protein